MQTPPGGGPGSEQAREGELNSPTRQKIANRFAAALRDPQVKGRDLGALLFELGVTMNRVTARSGAEGTTDEAIRDTLALIAHAHYVADRDACAPEPIMCDTPIGYLTGRSSISEDMHEWSLGLEDTTEVDLPAAERAVCAAYRELVEADRAELAKAQVKRIREANPS